MNNLNIKDPELSVIVPCLNEARYLAATVARLRQVGGAEDYELIVADSGSSDGTPELARQLGARVLADATIDCRADACNLGASQARGRVLLFLDADSEAPEEMFLHIRRLLADPRVIGGAFEFALSGPGIPLRIVELVNRLRYRIWRRYYGDQGLFVRTEIFHQAQGFPRRRILESSDLCKKLRQFGQLRLAPARMFTSSRRFREGGVWRVFGRDIAIWFLDLIGLPTDRYGAAYWRQNRERR